MEFVNSISLFYLCLIKNETTMKPKDYRAMLLNQIKTQTAIYQAELKQQPFRYAKGVINTFSICLN